MGPMRQGRQRTSLDGAMPVSIGGAPKQGISTSNLLSSNVAGAAIKGDFVNDVTS